LIVFRGQIFAPAGLRHDFFTVYQKKEPTAGTADRYAKEKYRRLPRPWPVVFI
jgi:hypothetical protein